MQDLNFRKKRRKKGVRTTKNTVKSTGRRPWRSYRGGLRFEKKGQKLHFEQERPRRRPGSLKSIGLWAVEILIVCMTAVLLVAAFGQRVSVAGDSMNPALENGDVVLVNHFIYNVKKPARGDIVAFRQNEGEHYSVKRIVGLPGETVQIADGKILIDGEELTGETYLSNIDYAGLAEEPVELGEDEYFVMGDNHASSDDSRLPSIGNISLDDIFGEVWFIVSPGENRGLV